MDNIENKKENIYQTVKTSEQQIREGKIKDAKESLDKLKEKYNL